MYVYFPCILFSFLKKKKEVGGKISDGFPSSAEDTINRAKPVVLLAAVLACFANVLPRRTDTRRDASGLAPRRDASGLAPRRDYCEASMRTGLLAATILACLAPGCRGFSLPALAPRRALRAPARSCTALRASADADAGLSKEQKLKKYQNLAVELITKANKLPPG